jgi:hypothetical protein
MMCIFVAVDFIVGHNHKLKTMLWCNLLKPSYIIILMFVINLIVYYGHPPLKMDATIFDGG